MKPRKLIAVVAGYLLLVALLLAVPAITTNAYYLHILILIGMNVILAMSFRLIMTTGQLSLAHAGFMLVGAYASAVLVIDVGISFWLAIFLSGLIALIIAVLFGYPILRIKGVYFFILTFALGSAFVEIPKVWPSVLGGFNGLSSIPRPGNIHIPGLSPIEFVSRVPYYYLILFLVAITVLVMIRFENSRLGKTLNAIGTNDTLSQSLGINIMNYKVFAFAVGCFFAGIVGSFYAHYIRYISPSSFDVWVTISILTYTVVGGSGKVFGPVIGAALITFITEILRVAGGYQTILYASLLILVILFVRGGIISLIERLPQLFASFVDFTKKRISHAT